MWHPRRLFAWGRAAPARRLPRCLLADYCPMHGAANRLVADVVTRGEVAQALVACACGDLQLCGGGQAWVPLARHRQLHGGDDLIWEGGICREHARGRITRAY